ncbi:MAG: type II toxin-antitoxin system VapC family toxin [Maricaulaceae bacterium]|nr:type II toxin-antitoxin system VapC family toxin [Maricaulaceae bacterium]
MKAECVLDASAILCVLQGEPGADTVAGVLKRAMVSAVNYAEAAGKLCDSGVTDTLAEEMLTGLGLAVMDFDAAQALRAGRLRTETRRFGLSLGDRACLALALREDAPVLTADREWVKLDLGLDIRVLR